MYPDLYNIIKNDPAVISALGDSTGIRFDPFGFSTQDGTLTYAVWQIIPGGGPENYLNDRPNIDEFIIQIDIYGITASKVRAAALALRDALEPHCYITSWRGESRETETKLYRYSFDLNIYNYR